MERDTSFSKEQADPERETVLAKGGAWRKLQGAGGNLMEAFAAFKKTERELEDSRP